MIRGLLSNLRAVERSDARFIRDLLNEPSTAAGWGISGVPMSIHRVESDIEQWIESERAHNRPAALIVESLDGAKVGLILVDVSERPNQSMATLSLALSAEHQQQGFGSDALSGVVDALFDEWGIHRVQVRCEADNQIAIKLYEASGFQREAVRKRATFTDGKWGDQIVFSMLSMDPRPDSA